MASALAQWTTSSDIEHDLTLGKKGSIQHSLAFIEAPRRNLGITIIEVKSGVGYGITTSCMFENHNRCGFVLHSNLYQKNPRSFSDISMALLIAFS